MNIEKILLTIIGVTAYALILDPLFGFMGIKFSYFTNSLFLISIFSISSFFLALLLLRKQNLKSFFLKIFIFYIVFMMVNGFNRSFLSFPVYLFEFMNHLRFISFLILGSIAYKSEVLKRYLIGYTKFGFYICLILVISGFFPIPILGNALIVSYNIQFFLYPSLIFIFNQDINRRDYTMMLFSFLLLFIIQLIFLKRLPTLLMTITTLIFFYYSSLKSKILSKYFSVFFRGAVLIPLVIIATNFPLFDYIDSLMKKSSGELGGVSTLEDVRWEIGDIIWADVFKNNDQITGRGLGSYVEDDSFFFDEINNKKVRTAAELGHPTAMLKGGFILLIFIAIFSLKIILSYPTFLKNRYYFGLWVFGFIWVVNFIPGGYIGNIHSINDVILAYFIGYLYRDKTNTNTINNKFFS
ncbi:MAG: hypothetical protein MH472_12520 [Bacteroidia bacterium]|nr:hypothetical protein [Bacteroidia bacterium]